MNVPSIFIIKVHFRFQIHSYNLLQQKIKITELTLSTFFIPLIIHLL